MFEKLLGTVVGRKIKPNKAGLLPKVNNRIKYGKLVVPFSEILPIRFADL